jgi:hypothetical protein
MNERIPWYAEFLTIEHFLIIVGALFLLCALGEVTLGTFAFRLAQDIPNVARPW